MTRDILLVTVECARLDYRDRLGADGYETARGVTAAHYTRPSMAGLLTGQYASVVDARAHTPTLAGALSRAGYHTAGVSYSPQTTAAFGFDAGFDDTHFLEPDSGRLTRGSKWRERLGESQIVRWLKGQVQDKRATFENIPRDTQAVSRALSTRATTDAPRFLWVHLMGSHRPYGWRDPLPRGADRETIVDYYERALERVGIHVQVLADVMDDDAVVAICGDHGEELGEDNIFFHGGFRRRLVDTLVNVPVLTRGLDVPDGVSLLDLPAYITDAVGADAPDVWDARMGRDHALSIAPWNDKASVRYQSDGVDVTFSDADRARVDAAKAVGESTKDHLRALGYADVG